MNRYYFRVLVASIVERAPVNRDFSRVKAGNFQGARREVLIFQYLMTNNI